MAAEHTSVLRELGLFRGETRAQLAALERGREAALRARLAQLEAVLRRVLLELAGAKAGAKGNANANARTNTPAKTHAAAAAAAGAGAKGLGGGPGLGQGQGQGAGRK